MAESEGQSHRIRWWAPLVVFAAILALQAALVVFWPTLAHQAGSGEPPARQLLGPLGRTLDRLVIFAVLAVALWLGRRPPCEALALRRARGRHFAVVPLLCVSVSVVEDVIFSALAGSAVKAGSPVDVEALLIASLVPVLLTPFAEELLFRGYILGAYLQRSVWLGVLISSLLFQGFHVGGLHLLTGAALAYATWRARSVWPAIVAHAAINAAVTASHALGLGGYPPWLALPLGVIALGCVYTLRAHGTAASPG